MDTYVDIGAAGDQIARNVNLLKKPQRKCIFCGEQGLSKEHIIPEWLHKYIILAEKTHVMTITSGLRGEKSEKKYNGDMMSRRPRIVCRKCNETWMSSIQNESKSIVLDLVLGNNRLLTPADQEQLATWVTMTTICGEYLNHESRAIQANTQREFYLRRKPLPRWAILLGRFDSEIARGYHRSCLTLDFEVQISTNQGSTPWMKANHPDFRSDCRHNAQATTILIRNFVVHAVSIPIDHVPVRMPKQLSQKLVSILPSATGDIDVGQLPILSESEYLALTTVFRDYHMSRLDGS